MLLVSKRGVHFGSELAYTKIPIRGTDDPAWKSHLSDRIAVKAAKEDMQLIHGELPEKT